MSACAVGSVACLPGSGLLCRSASIRLLRATVLAVIVRSHSACAVGFQFVGGGLMSPPYVGDED
eukprot:6272253-Heterocapsa_arctica.AAC.1